MAVKVEMELEDVTFEPGYRIRFNRRVEHTCGDMDMVEQEGIISQVKDGGGLVVIVPEGSKFMVSFVNKDDVTEILNKMI